ncbi:hypothetical protein VOLCADRAFT_98589 [Volvox carteri f. nagariensis]|uniref:Uncharacterized protein n=1 Tax=Volvox carteri f. nagariensis TaxID=3068 RepID=D8UFR4_VOLCA|nr:uncharacterized protein VOLCADRAFT_98589 [Volvox carteri f. nagariensis]EFJ41425.1 hypothetical protein VOLCADRAFT_98589 [Volvox carteri f. nagariensis]|eukprot:XP_002957531.1 hypothetical protein VOLCADRAFT_98589 [Volvox carteri f. nagariensis]
MQQPSGIKLRQLYRIHSQQVTLDPSVKQQVDRLRLIRDCAEDVLDAVIGCSIDPPLEDVATAVNLAFPVIQMLACEGIHHARTVDNGMPPAAMAACRNLVVASRNALGRRVRNGNPPLELRQRARCNQLGVAPMPELSAWLNEHGRPDRVASIMAMSVRQEERKRLLLAEVKSVCVPKHGMSEIW